MSFGTNDLFASTVRTRLCWALGLLVLFLQEVAARQKLRMRKKNDIAAFYVGLTLGLIFFAFGCMYCCRKLCPEGPTLSSLELDEIRLERLDDVERRLQQEMQQIQQKLALHRDRKREMQNKREESRRVALSERETDTLWKERERLLDAEGQEHVRERDRERDNALLRALSPSPRKHTHTEPSKTDEEKESDSMWKEWGKLRSGSDSVKVSAGKKQSQKEKSDRKETEEFDKIYAYQSMRFENKHPVRSSSSAASISSSSHDIAQNKQSSSAPPRTPAKENAVMASSPAILKTKAKTNTSVSDSLPRPQTYSQAKKVGDGDIEEYAIQLPRRDYTFSGASSSSHSSSISLSSASVRRPPPPARPENSVGNASSTSNMRIIGANGARPPPPRGPPPGYRAASTVVAKDE